MGASASLGDTPGCHLRQGGLEGEQVCQAGSAGHQSILESGPRGLEENPRNSDEATGPGPCLQPYGDKAWQWLLHVFRMSCEARDCLSSIVRQLPSTSG